MEALRNYILSLTGISMVCSALLSLIPEGMTRSAAKLVCGVILAMTVLSPFSGVSLSLQALPAAAASEEAEAAVAEGSSRFAQQRNSIIIRQLEAYILERANSLGISAEVELRLDDEGIPASCTIRADTTRNLRSRLEDILFTELGIAKEDQQWIG